MKNILDNNKEIPTFTYQILDKDLQSHDNFCSYIDRYFGEDVSPSIVMGCVMEYATKYIDQITPRIRLRLHQDAVIPLHTRSHTPRPIRTDPNKIGFTINQSGLQISYGAVQHLLKSGLSHCQLGFRRNPLELLIIPCKQGEIGSKPIRSHSKSQGSGMGLSCGSLIKAYGLRSSHREFTDCTFGIDGSLGCSLEKFRNKPNGPTERV